MKHDLDLVVVGSGAGASAAAYQCKAAGWSVAMIDSLPFGGTCQLRGCDPKKVLIGAANLIDWSRRMANNGVKGDLHIDWPALMKFKNTFTEPVPAQHEKSMINAGIQPFHGRARFTGPDTLEVGDDTLTARHILLANGARPASLNIPGEKLLTYSDQFLELEQLPRRILFVGGGYISFEFAFLAATAGAEVHIVHRGDRSLHGFDPDLVDILSEKAKALGIVLHLQTAPTRIEKSAGGLTVHASRNGKAERFTADLIVHGAGRVPDLDDINLVGGKVERGKGGIKVNAYLQSVSNPNVYAAGDAAATAGLPLTPVAAMESRVVASNLLNGNQLTPDYSAIPTVAFTTPPLASVGLSESEARDQGVKFSAHFEKTAGWYSSRRVGEQYSASKVLVDPDTGQILGAHLLGPHSDELINQFAMAMRYKLSRDDLKKMIHAYPTHGSDIGYMV